MPANEGARLGPATGISAQMGLGSGGCPIRPTVIRAGGALALPDPRELWAYRDLLYFLTWRDVKVRYRQTLLGVAWAVLQPLLTMAIFAVLFGRLAHVPSNNIPYPLFAFAGLLPWTFFSNAVTNSANSLVGSASLVTKVYFPRLIIPLSAVLAALVDLALAFVLLVPLMLYYRAPLRMSLVLVPLLLLPLTALLALAVGMWLSALNVKYRDVRHALPFLIQVWMFVTPIIYPLSLVPERWRWAFYLNPLTGVIEGLRSALFGTTVDLSASVCSVLLTVALLAYAVFSFRQMERTFADVV